MNKVSTVKELKIIYKDLKKNGLIKKPLTGLNKKQIINELTKLNAKASINNSVKDIQGKGLIKDVIKNVKNWLFFPSSKMPEKSQKVLNKYKDKNIKSIKIYREPIDKKIQSFLNFLSLGQYNKAKEISNFDDLYHLYAILELEDGSNILLEKNENIYIRDDYKKNPNSENINITINKSINLDELLYNTEKKAGKFDFYQYNAKTNNCQDFLLMVLKSNDLLNDEAKKFIKQDLETLFQNLPSWSNKFTQLLTDLRSKISEIFGLGNKRKRKIKKTIKH